MTPFNITPLASRNQSPLVSPVRSRRSSPVNSRISTPVLSPVNSPRNSPPENGKSDHYVHPRQCQRESAFDEPFLVRRPPQTCSWSDPNLIQRHGPFPHDGKTGLRHTDSLDSTDFSPLVSPLTSPRYGLLVFENSYTIMNIYAINTIPWLISIINEAIKVKSNKLSVPTHLIFQDLWDGTWKSQITPRIRAPKKNCHHNPHLALVGSHPRFRWNASDAFRPVTLFWLQPTSVAVPPRIPTSDLRNNYIVKIRNVSAQFGETHPCTTQKSVKTGSCFAASRKSRGSRPRLFTAADSSWASKKVQT